jgi:hypothetical protein
VSRRRLARAFWIGAAAVLVAAALVSVSAILRGDFGETDAKVLGTLLSLLVAGATVVTGLGLVERGVQPALGWIAVVGAVVCFALQAAAIWDGFSDDVLTKASTTSMALLLALLLVATQRTLLREERLVKLFYATAAAAGLAVALTAVGIWTEEGAFWQPVAVLSILAVLGYLLLPVAQHVTTGAQDSGVRVLATLDDVELVATRSSGGVAVELAPGERLLLRRAPRS